MWTVGVSVLSPVCSVDSGRVCFKPSLQCGQGACLFYGQLVEWPGGGSVLSPACSVDSGRVCFKPSLQCGQGAGLF